MAASEAPTGWASWPNRLLLAALALMPSLFNLTLPVFIALGLHKLWKSRKLWREALDTHWPLCSLLSVTLALTPFAAEPARHLYGWLCQLAFGALIWLLIRQSLRDDGLQATDVLSALLLGALPICLIGWLQYFNLGFIVRFLALPPSDGLWSFFLIDWLVVPVQHAHARVYSLFFAPPMLGVYLATLLPLALNKVQQAKSRERQALWGLTLFLLLSVLALSFTRIAWIAAIISVALYLLLCGTRRAALWLLAGSATLAALSLIALPGIWMHTWQRMSTLLALENHSNSGRLEIWLRSWEAILARPLTGHGLLSFWPVFPDYRWRMPHTHSLILQQLFETGLIATTLFYAWLSQVFRRLGRDPFETGIGCSLLAWLICGWADHPGFESRNLLLFWILAGISTYLKSRVAVYPSLSAPS